MARMDSDQLRHDEINLRRLLQNIRSSVEKVDLRRRSGSNVQLLQKDIINCRTLLEKLKSNEYVPKDLSMLEWQDAYDSIEKDINELELALVASSNQGKMKSFMNLSILSSLSQLWSSSEKVSSDSDNRGSSSSLKTTKVLPASTKSWETLSVSNDSASTSRRTLIGDRRPQASSAMQDELAEQLAQMARQLKDNALLFNDALTKDKNVVVDAQTKIDENYDSVTKERVRVHDLGRKSSGSTCLVILSILIVVIAFTFTFFVIRLT